MTGQRRPPHGRRRAFALATADRKRVALSGRWYRKGLTDVFGLLAENPRMARVGDEFARPVRLYPYRAHVGAYGEHEDGILIVRMLNGRRDWSRHLA